MATSRKDRDRSGANRLLFANMPLAELMTQYARYDFARPQVALAGRTSEGHFATAVAKEYPRLLNQAFAMATARRLPLVNAELTREQTDLLQTARYWSHFCKEVAGVQQPDYQPQSVALHV